MNKQFKPELVKEKIKDLEEKRQLSIKASNDYQSENYRFENDFMADLKNFLLSCSGCRIHALLVDDSVYFYNVNDAGIFNDGSGWAKQDPEDEVGYGIPLEEKWQPMPYSKLEDIMQKVKDRYCLDVKICGLKKKTKPEKLCSFKDIKMHHPSSNVHLLDDGKKEYVGWDISDNYFIVLIDGVKHAYWAHGAHGNNELVNHAIEGHDSWNNFETFLEG